MAKWPEFVSRKVRISIRIKIFIKPKGFFELKEQSFRRNELYRIRFELLRDNQYQAN